MSLDSLQSSYAFIDILPKDDTALKFMNRMLLTLCVTNRRLLNELLFLFYYYYYLFYYSFFDKVRGRKKDPTIRLKSTSHETIRQWKKAKHLEYVDGYNYNVHVVCSSLWIIWFYLKKLVGKTGKIFLVHKILQRKNLPHPFFKCIMYTGCPHKKYTEIKITIMAKLLYIWEREIYL